MLNQAGVHIWRLYAVVVATALILGSLVAAVPAVASDPTGTISGTIQLPAGFMFHRLVIFSDQVVIEPLDGRPLEVNARVTKNWVGTVALPSNMATIASVEYTVSGVDPARSYRIGYWTGGDTGNLAPGIRWWNAEGGTYSKSLAGSVVPSTTPVDFDVELAATINGTVTLPADFDLSSYGQGHYWSGYVQALNADDPNIDQSQALYWTNSSHTEEYAIKVDPGDYRVMWLGAHLINASNPPGLAAVWGGGVVDGNPDWLNTHPSGATLYQLSAGDTVDVDLSVPWSIVSTVSAYPIIVGEPTVGATITVVPASLTCRAACATSGYEWLVDQIPVAVGSRFTIPSSAIGKEITVNQTVIGDGYAPAIIQSSGMNADAQHPAIVQSRPPFGWLDSATLVGPLVTARGWAIDPDIATAAIQVDLIVDWTVAATAFADEPRPGLAAAIGSSGGDAHAYSLSATLTPGKHTICVLGVGADSAGPNAWLLHTGADAVNNCAVVTYPGSRPPFGWLDTASLTGSTLTASGWAMDPDTASGIQVQLTVDGSVVTTGTANLPKPGLAAAINYPQLGDNHAYSVTTTLTPGKHTICVVGVNDDSSGPNTRLLHGGADAVNNCAVVDYPGSKPPFGWLDSASLVGSTVTATGWAMDPDTASAIQVQLTIDGTVVVTGTANVPKPGLAAAIGYDALGDNHAYSMTAALSPGKHTVCVVGVNDDSSGPNSRLLHRGSDAVNNCAVVDYPGSRPPFGWLDSASLVGSTLTAKGWAMDPDTASAIQVQLTVDGTVAATGTANLPKPGLAAAIGYPQLGDDHAYSMTATLTQGVHAVCVVGVNDDSSGPNARLLHGGADAVNNCAVVNYPGPKSPFGWLDSASLIGSTVTASGWAMDPDTASAIQVQLTVDGSVVTTGTANISRSGLAAAINAPQLGDDHAYSMTATLTPGTHTICMVGVDNDGISPNTRLLHGGADAANNCAVVNYSGP